MGWGWPPHGLARYRAERPLGFHASPEARFALSQELVNYADPFGQVRSMAADSGRRSGDSGKTTATSQSIAQGFTGFFVVNWCYSETRTMSWERFRLLLQI